MLILLRKFKETLLTVLPIVFIVALLNIFVVAMPLADVVRFLIGSIFVAIGLTIFILGVDIGITPIGNLLGNRLAKSNKIAVVILLGFIIGFIITIAEPSLLILSQQIESITGGLIKNTHIILGVSVGTGIMVCVGIIRIVYARSQRLFLFFFYALVLFLSIFCHKDFLAIAFDASGATTGALAVPFILAIALGTSRMEKDSLKKESDSFGLAGIASIGAILAVLIMGLIFPSQQFTGAFDPQPMQGIFTPFLHHFFPQLLEVFIIFLPILVVFLVENALHFKVDKVQFIRICFGLLFSFVGLSFFLLGVNQGFMQIGMQIGMRLAQKEYYILLLVIAFVLGVVTILAEPAVHILTRQIEEVTSGFIKARLVLSTLALGVGVAILLATLKVLIPGLAFWHLVLPGYILALALSFFTPPLFVGIAFDSGGVASGPMTATFVLAFVQGVAYVYPEADILLDGFGVISLVAMTPLIALQILGVLYTIRLNKIKALEQSDTTVL